MLHFELKKQYRVRIKNLVLYLSLPTRNKYFVKEKERERTEKERGEKGFFSFRIVMIPLCVF
jgi:hypothetical protein